MFSVHSARHKTQLTLFCGLQAHRSTYVLTRLFNSGNRWPGFLAAAQADRSRSLRMVRKAQRLLRKQPRDCRSRVEPELSSAAFPWRIFRLNDAAGGPRGRTSNQFTVMTIIHGYKSLKFRRWKTGKISNRTFTVFLKNHR